MAKNIPILGVTEKNYSRVNYGANITYFTDNIFFTVENECHAVFKLINYDYEFKGFRHKINLHERLKRLFNGITEEFQILDIPVSTNIEEQHEKLKDLCLKKQTDMDLAAAAIKEIDEMTDIIVENNASQGKGHRYDTYLIIKLKKVKIRYTSIKQLLKSFILEPKRIINKISGMDTPEIFISEYKLYKSAENLLFSNISRQLKCERVAEQDIQRLIKYIFYYGISDPPLIGDSKNPKKRFTFKPEFDTVFINGEEVMMPRDKQLLRLCECDIDISKPNMIKIEQLYKGRKETAYQAYIVVSNIPDGIVPDGEWHYVLKESCDFPILTSVRSTVVANKIARDELDRKTREIQGQKEHVESDQETDNPQDLREQLAEARVLDLELKQGKEPLFYTNIVLVVSAKSPGQLEQRVAAVRGALDPISSELPRGDQFTLMNEVLLGGHRYLKDYTLRLPAGHIALMTPGASTEIGDNEGFIFAITGALLKVVRLAPWLPSLLNLPPSASFTGTQGGGKSFLSNLLVLLACKIYGAHALIIDPKNDRTDWKKYLKSFGNQIAITTFTKDVKDFGKLDPYIIMANSENGNSREEKMKAASEVARDILTFLLGVKKNDDAIFMLYEATTSVEEMSNPCMNKVIIELEKKRAEAEKNKEDYLASRAKSFIRTLKELRKMPFAGLLFGNGGEQVADFSKRINILQIQELVLPDEEKTQEDFTHQEMIGYSCLLAISACIKSFIMGDRKILKMFLLDEAKVLNSTAIGKGVMKSLAFMARALNTPGYFITQSVGDLGSTNIRNNIGYKFAFRATEPEEISTILKYFKLEENERNIDIISNLKNGSCLYQDVYGRTAVIGIISLIEEYFDALDTRPIEKGA